MPRPRRPARPSRGAARCLSGGIRSACGHKGGPRGPPSGAAHAGGGRLKLCRPSVAASLGYGALSRRPGRVAPGGRHSVFTDGAFRFQIVTVLTAPTMLGLVARIWASSPPAAACARTRAAERRAGRSLRDVACALAALALRRPAGRLQACTRLDLGETSLSVVARRVAGIDVAQVEYKPRRAEDGDRRGRGRVGRRGLPPPGR